jgi:hypothetical protein
MRVAVAMNSLWNLAGDLIRISYRKDITCEITFISTGRRTHHAEKISSFRLRDPPAYLPHGSEWFRANL